MKISEIKQNSNNPRIIKDDKYKKLLNSIKEFPKMLELRPIVIDKNNMILGWNMRYKACKELWIKEVPVKIAEDLTPEEEQRFIIEDNVWFWEWNMEDLANNWNAEDLENWWVDLNFLDENADDSFNLPNWEKWELQTITFTLHKFQMEILEKAMDKSKNLGDFWDTLNTNRNWNAIARVCELFLNQK
jgi:hypothetical protein